MLHLQAAIQYDFYLVRSERMKLVEKHRHSKNYL
jgi:hypothetical protein